MLAVSQQQTKTFFSMSSEGLEKTWKGNNLLTLCIQCSFMLKSSSEQKTWWASHLEKLWYYKVSPGLGSGGVESTSHSVLVSLEARLPWFLCKMGLKSDWKFSSIISMSVKLQFGEWSLCFTAHSVIQLSFIRHLLSLTLLGAGVGSAFTELRV